MLQWRELEDGWGARGCALDVCTTPCPRQPDREPTARMVLAGWLQIQLACTRKLKCVRVGYNVDWLLVHSISVSLDLNPSNVQCPLGAGKVQYHQLLCIVI